ncbi:zinc finger protein 664 isoform X2 [Meriones unguiculatus]|uniref:zinc finger protein 664 isoform X2 n=1 Tax=Meriones unguiculatus TaxID=10047 RepID=UPI000B4FB9D8|nr:zinc finger protein 664 isoform X2 [Meriones unguiculatus]
MRLPGRELSVCLLQQRRLGIGSRISKPAPLGQDLQIQETSFWKIRELPPQDQEKKTSVLLYRILRSKIDCPWSQEAFMLARPAM